MISLTIVLVLAHWQALLAEDRLDSPQHVGGGECGLLVALLHRQEVPGTVLQGGVLARVGFEHALYKQH